MKNDLDLVRLILTSVRDRTDLWPKPVNVTGYDPLVVARHVERLHADGLVDGHLENDLIGQPVAVVQATDLSSAGHEFLAAMESTDVWSRVRSALAPSELATLSIGAIAGLGRDLALVVARQKLGLD